MNRRTFIRAGAFLAATTAVPFAAERPRIKAGFLGITHSHGQGKYRVVSRSADFEVVGVCDPSPAGREIILQLGARPLDQQELLTQSDLVVVESAVAELAENARAALAAGRHVHVEKPPTTTISAMRELVQLAREKNRLLQTGYMWRYNPGFELLLEAVKGGWLGEIHQVRGRMNTLIAPERRPEWAQFKGGATFEQGCHLIDPLVRMLGRPSAITPFLKRSAAIEDNLKDNNTVVFEFPRATAMISNSTLQPNAFPHRCFEIIGSNGLALLQPIEQPRIQLDLASDAGPYRKGTHDLDFPEYRRYEGDFTELASAIRGEGKLRVSLAEELLLQETVLRASEMV